MINNEETLYETLFEPSNSSTEEDPFESPLEDPFESPLEDPLEDHLEDHLEDPLRVDEINQCRICLEEEVNLDLLLSPCLCNGTSKYVHHTCLRTWRYQNIHAVGFVRCMECNEPYIILNNPLLEDEGIFKVFNENTKVMYFQIIISAALTIYIYTIDSIVGNVGIIQLYPRWYNDRLLNLVTYNSYLQNMLYIDFAIYIQNLIFILMYIWRCNLYITRKKQFFILMTPGISFTLLYYHGYWLLTIAMFAYELQEFSLISMMFYQVLSYNANYNLLKNHNKYIKLVNDELETGVEDVHINII